MNGNELYSATSADRNASFPRPRFLTGIFLFYFMVTVTGFSNEFSIPKPTGAHQVGTEYFYFVDQSRPESFTKSKSDFREVTGQVWYPATPAADANPQFYRSNEETDILSAVEAAYFGLLVNKVPADLFSHFSTVPTHSHTKAPLADSPSAFPVLIYSHGIIGGHVATHTVLMEELASHGYIVLSVSHAYQTPYLKYPDGSIKVFSPGSEGIRKSAAAIFDSERTAIYQKLYETTDVKTQKALLEQLASKQPFLEESLDIWSADVRFIIDELEKLNSGNTFLKGRLDLDRIGVLGWSFGGATAGQVLLTDSRCKAGINIDGLPLGDLVHQKIQQPFMFMRNGSRDMVQYFVDQIANDAYVVKLNGSTHFSFTDMALYNIPEVDQICGDIDGRQAVSIVNYYVRSFFDKYLKGKNISLSAGEVFPDSEIEFQFQAKG